jgi:hypothetical protein
MPYDGSAPVSVLEPQAKARVGFVAAHEGVAVLEALLQYVLL